MSKTVISIMIFCSMLVTHPMVALAQTGNGGDFEKMKTEVSLFGTGPHAKVVVKLKNGTTRKGYIVKTSKESFELADAKTHMPISVSYGDVRSIKGAGTGSSKLWIRTGIIAALVVTAVVFAPKRGPGICTLSCR